MGLTLARHNAGSITQNLNTYIKAIEGGGAWPDYIKDALRIAGEVKGARNIAEYSHMLDLVKKLEATEQKYRKAYAGLSPMQRPAETAGANDYEASNNIQQQASDSGKTSAQIAKEGLDARMKGETFTPYQNRFLAEAQEMRNQGMSNSEIKKALEAKGATGANITSTFSDLGTSFAGQKLGADGVGIEGSTRGTTLGTAGATGVAGAARTKAESFLGADGATSQSQANAASAASSGADIAAMIANDARIPDALKPLFQRVVDGWDPNQELNFDNVLGAFNKIQESTIDPYFKEQISQFTNDISEAVKYQSETNALETEQMGITKDRNIRQTRQGLESSGMTFTGEGVKQLGAESAFARPGQGQSAIPMQTPFAGGQFEEGSTMQANRMMTTSTGLRQKKAAQDIARQAEKVLGSTGAQGLVPGAKLMGDVTQGSIAAEKQKAQTSTLDSLYGQQQQLNDYSKPVKLFN